MTSANARKGSSAEREVARLISDLTGWNIKRRYNLGTQEDVGDLYGFPDDAVVVQVANWADVTRAVRQKPIEAEQQRINAGATFAVTFVRLRGGEFRAVMTVEQLCTLLREAVEP